MAVECTYCEEKVNAKRGIYIKCTKCLDIKLCLECFSAGATIADHESDHPYELIDCGSFPIIDDTWKAHEELALLEGIELYGIGSWTDIANAVETRSADECCERYLRVYVDNFFGRSAWNAIDRDLYSVRDHTCHHNQPLSPCLSLPEKHKIVDISKEQQLRLGYMPKRDDFEREYDNEAELLVSKLAVNANDDTDLDQDLKIAHINMYTDKLRERFRRKRIVLEYNLVKLFFHMHPEENGDLQSNTQQDPDSLNQSQSMIIDTAVSAKAMPTIKTGSLANVGDEHRSTTDGKVDNKTTIPKNESTANGKAQAQNTILNYFRRIDESSTPTKESSKPPEKSILSSYFSDLNKTIAEQDFNTMEKKLRIFCQFSSAEEHNQLIRNLAREKELKVKIKELIKKRKRGLKFHNSTQSVNGNDSDASVIQSPSNKKTSVKTISSVSDDPMDVDSDDTSTLTPTKVTQKKNNNKNESTKAIMNMYSNQNSEPNWRLLTESEKKICRSSNLKPSQYMSFKALLIKEHKQRRRGSSQKLFTDDIDKNVKKKIVDYLARNNWIKV